MDNNAPTQLQEVSSSTSPLRFRDQASRNEPTNAGDRPTQVQEITTTRPFHYACTIAALDRLVPFD